MNLKPIYYHEPGVYGIPGFEPHIIDRQYLKSLGVAVNPDDDTVLRKWAVRSLPPQFLKGFRI